MENILSKYAALLASVDQWFAACVAHAGSKIACKTGCAECCRALFDITLLDALYLKSGFDRLDAGIRAHVLEKAKGRLLLLQTLWPDFEAPYILNYRPEEEWEMLMPDDDETPCPLLAEDGTCLVYDFRPMTCRLHGLPLLDVSGEVMYDGWCTLNFTKENPLEMDELRWEFNTLFRKELVIFRELTFKLFKHKVNELDTFIPTALLIDFDHFPWRKWREDNPLLFPEWALEEKEFYDLEEVSPELAWNSGGVSIRGGRGKEGLTQKQLAELTGIAQHHISEMENGKRPIGKETARKLAKALNIDYRVFL